MGNQGRECGWAALIQPQPPASPRGLRAEPAFLPWSPQSTPIQRRGLLNPDGCRCSLPCPQRSSAQPAEGLAGDGGEGGREGDYFWHQQKYLRRHLAALFIRRARALLHHNRRPVVSGACACSHVCTCTHPALCTVYTHGDTLCTPGHTPHCPPAPCVGALPCPAWASRLWHSSPKSRAPATLPGSVGGYGGGRMAPVHSLPRALCGELGQLCPWGCTVLAEPVPWQERGSATSRAEPRTPVTSNAPGQGPNFPPARERHAGSEAGVGERRGDPVGRRHPEPDPCPQLAPLQR